MDAGTTVSLFTVDLSRAVAAWRARPHEDLAPAQARLHFDAVVEREAAARLYDAPRASLAAVLSALGLELAGLEDAPPAYPHELRPGGRERGGLRLWLASPPRIPDLAGAPPPGVDPALWQDLMEAVAELLQAAARPGMTIVGAVT